MANNAQLANLFELTSGSDHVTYSSSSIAGVPLLSYRTRRASYDFRGDQIRHTSTELGTLVSVTLQTIPDLKTVVFSLLLPNVRVLMGSGGTHVEVPGVVTTVHTTIAGPPMGPEQTYDASSFRGTAQAVIF